MSTTETDETQAIAVLVNDEEQYCFWPGDKAAPPGWRTVKEGPRAECADFVRNLWTDMRPLSIRAKAVS